MLDILLQTGIDALQSAQTSINTLIARVSLLVNLTEASLNTLNQTVASGVSNAAKKLQVDTDNTFHYDLNSERWVASSNGNPTFMMGEAIHSAQSRRISLVGSPLNPFDAVNLQFTDLSYLGIQSTAYNSDRLGNLSASTYYHSKQANAEIRMGSESVNGAGNFDGIRFNDTTNKFSFLADDVELVSFASTLASLTYKGDRIITQGFADSRYQDITKGWIDINSSGDGILFDSEAYVWSEDADPNDAGSGQIATHYGRRFYATSSGHNLYMIGIGSAGGSDPLFVVNVVLKAGSRTLVHTNTKDDTNYGVPVLKRFN